MCLICSHIYLIPVNGDGNKMKGRNGNPCGLYSQMYHKCYGVKNMWCTKSGCTSMNVYMQKKQFQMHNSASAWVNVLTLQLIRIDSKYVRKMQDVYIFIRSVLT